jgi:hypothetical protein
VRSFFSSRVRGDELAAFAFACARSQAIVHRRHGQAEPNQFGKGEINSIIKKKKARKAYLVRSGPYSCGFDNPSCGGSLLFWCWPRRSPRGVERERRSPNPSSSAQCILPPLPAYPLFFLSFILWFLFVSIALAQCSLLLVDTVEGLISPFRRVDYPRAGRNTQL